MILRAHGRDEWVVPKTPTQRVTVTVATGGHRVQVCLNISHADSFQARIYLNANDATDLVTALQEAIEAGGAREIAQALTMAADTIDPLAPKPREELL